MGKVSDHSAVQRVLEQKLKNPTAEKNGADVVRVEPRVDCQYWDGCFTDDDKCLHEKHKVPPHGYPGYCEPNGCADKKAWKR